MIYFYVFVVLFENKYFVLKTDYYKIHRYLNTFSEFFKNFADLVTSQHPNYLTSAIKHAYNFRGGIPLPSLQAQKQSYGGQGMEPNSKAPASDESCGGKRSHALVDQNVGNAQCLQRLRQTNLSLGRGVYPRHRQPQPGCIKHLGGRVSFSVDESPQWGFSFPQSYSKCVVVPAAVCAVKYMWFSRTQKTLWRLFLSIFLTILFMFAPGQRVVSFDHYSEYLTY